MNECKRMRKRDKKWIPFYKGQISSKLSRRTKFIPNDSRKWMNGGETGVSDGFSFKNIDPQGQPAYCYTIYNAPEKEGIMWSSMQCATVGSLQSLGLSVCLSDCERSLIRSLDGPICPKLCRGYKARRRRTGRRHWKSFSAELPQRQIARVGWTVGRTNGQYHTCLVAGLTQPVEDVKTLEQRHCNESVW